MKILQSPRHVSDLCPSVLVEEECGDLVKSPVGSRGDVLDDFRDSAGRFYGAPLPEPMTVWSCGALMLKRDAAA